MVATSASRGQLERAGRLLGASERLREQSGLYDAPSFSFHQQWVGQIMAGEDASSFEQARAAGRTLSAVAAAKEALRVPVDEPRNGDRNHA
jgi:hypothetical protein